VNLVMAISFIRRVRVSVQAGLVSTRPIDRIRPKQPLFAKRP
jgi:hypothetical protein